nr:reverse transcriptase domain-containing protein [Tanacetum cinerariifolium]
NLFPPIDNLEITIQRRSRTDLTLLNDSEMATEGPGDLPVPDLRTMEELCQPSLNGRGGPIALIAIQETNFGLKNYMIQQVQNSYQFHGLSGETFMKRRPEECYDLIENMTAHHNDCDTSAQWSESSSSITSSSDTEIAALKAEMAEIKKKPYESSLAIVGNTQNVYAAGAYQGNTITNPKEDLKGITTHSGIAYQGPTIPTTYSSPVVERETEATKNMVHPTNNENTEDVQPLVFLTESQILNSERVISPIIEPVASLVSASRPNQRPSIPYPSRLHDQKLQLADRFISHPVRVAEYVRQSRSFLKTGRALIYVFEGELTLRVRKEAITFNLNQTSRYLANYNDMTANQIDVIDMAFEEYSQEVLSFFDVIAKVDAFLALEDDPTSLKVDESYVDIEGDILLLEAFLNDDPSLPTPNQGNFLPQVRKELKICEAKSDKSSIDEPPDFELKDLPSHLKYAFLEGDDKLPVIIAKDLSVEEKTALITVLKSHKRAIAWKLSNIKEAIVLGHKISKNGIEVDKAKVDIIAKLPHPTNVKGIHSFLGHASFYRRFIQDFSKIARPMTRLLEKDTSFLFSKECVEAFQTLKRKLTEALILIAPDWDMPFELICDASDFAIDAVLGQRQEKHFRPIHYASKTMIEVLLLQDFTFKVIETKRAENLAADHLSRLENPHQNVLDPKEINESFPLETLNLVSSRGNLSIPWFADFENYHARNFVIKGMSSQQKNIFFKDVKYYL